MASEIGIERGVKEPCLAVGREGRERRIGCPLARPTDAIPELATQGQDSIAALRERAIKLGKVRVRAQAGMSDLAPGDAYIWLRLRRSSPVFSLCPKLV